MENTLKQRSITIEREPTSAQVQIDWNTVEHRFKHHIKRFQGESFHTSTNPIISLNMESRQQLIGATMVATMTKRNWIHLFSLESS